MKPERFSRQHWLRLIIFTLGKYDDSAVFKI